MLRVVAVQELSQLRIVLHQDASLKPVFNELDGFIIVVNVISALRDSSESDQDQWLTLMSQAFAVLSEALSNSLRNLRAFEVRDTAVLFLTTFALSCLVFHIGPDRVFYFARRCHHGCGFRTHSSYARTVPLIIAWP